MTVCASPGVSAAREQEGAPPPSAADGDGGPPPAGCAITVDGAYAARLARSGGSWYPERWTLDGPEPYAVPLPGNQPEEPGTELQPMGDGRVLIRRLVAGRNTFSLLYPTGPGTGELPVGAVECPDGTRLRLLPPAPGGRRAYALAVGSRSSAVWLVAGGAFGPELLAEVEGHCSGGVWLDRAGRMLALDRRIAGRTRTVVVDLGRGGAVSPLLQIAPHSEDRLLLADLDSGLLLIRSDAPSPGQHRLGWGVLGSTLPVRFPQCLRLPDCTVTPFAIQPGQVLTPEQCAVALRCDGAFGSWVGVWRPVERRVRHLPAPEGWLAGAGLWTAEGVLRLPYATRAMPCGVARWTPPAREPARPRGALAPHLALPAAPSPAAADTTHGAGRGALVTPRGAPVGASDGALLGARRAAALPDASREAAADAPAGAEGDRGPDAPHGPETPGTPETPETPGTSGPPEAPVTPETPVMFEGGSGAPDGAPDGTAATVGPDAPPVGTDVAPGGTCAPGDSGAPGSSGTPGAPPTLGAPHTLSAQGAPSALVTLATPFVPLLPLTPHTPGTGAPLTPGSGTPGPGTPEPGTPDPAGMLPAPSEHTPAPDTPGTPEPPEAEVPEPPAPRPVTLQQAARTGRMTGHMTGRMATR